jgi:glycosyltransferase involved in cell wall biosynthesis
VEPNVVPNDIRMLTHKLDTHGCILEPLTKRIPFSKEPGGKFAENGSFSRTPRQWLPSLSVVIPCFNEAANLNRLLPRLQDTLKTLVPNWEVILVDDGSSDHTPELLEFWSGQSGFHAIQLSRNFGKEAALTAGLEASSCDVVVVMDADLQHSPELIPTMLAQWQRGYDVVYAVREHRKDEGIIKRLGSRWFYRLVNAGGRFQVPADAGDFRLMDNAAVNALLALPERNRFMKGLYAWVGFSTTEISYMPEARGNGRSAFNLFHLIGLSLDGLTAFTTWPLRIVSLIGLVLALLAFGYGGYLVVDFLLNGHPVPGWTTIVVGLMLFSGIQLIGLGVLGEYVSRIFEEVKGRPLYVVRHRAGRSLREDRP